MQIIITDALFRRGAGRTIYWPHENFNHRYDFLKAAIKAENAILVEYLINQDPEQVTKMVSDVYMLSLPTRIRAFIHMYVHANRVYTLVTAAYAQV